MYRQLDERILDNEVRNFLVSNVYWWFLLFIYLLILVFYQRSSFGFALRMHIYSDCSILVCDYLAHGTLQVGLINFVSRVLLGLVFYIMQTLMKTFCRMP